jgi:hypothetical protein
VDLVLGLAPPCPGEPRRHRDRSWRRGACWPHPTWESPVALRRKTLLAAPPGGPPAPGSPSPGKARRRPGLPRSCWRHRPR